MFCFVMRAFDPAALVAASDVTHLHLRSERCVGDKSVAVLYRSEIPSGMCAQLRTVAASSNRDHPTRSRLSSPLACTVDCSPGSQALLEVTHQDHSIGITLSLLVRATYICFCS